MSRELAALDDDSWFDIHEGRNLRLRRPGVNELDWSGSVVSRERTDVVEAVAVRRRGTGVYARVPIWMDREALERLEAQPRSEQEYSQAVLSGTVLGGWGVTVSEGGV